MGDIKSPVTLEEVKKLQDLVRKLEIQNLHLKNKQNMERNRSVSPVKTVKSLQKSNAYSENFDAIGGKAEGKEELISEFNNVNEYFDDLEIIRVSDIEMSDDESWLYSPKSEYQELTEEKKCTEDLECKQLQFPKNSLLIKLNELKIFSTPKTSFSDVSSDTSVEHQIVFKKPASLSIQPQNSVHVDSRTFTRSRKKQAVDFLEKLNALGRGISSDLPPEERSSDISLDSLSSYHVVEDANDVQEVARLQEESLKRNSFLGTPRRKEAANEYGESTNDSSHYSDHSSQSGSPYGSNASLHNVGKEKAKFSTYRRSLPNLNRDPTVMKLPKTKVAIKTLNTAALAGRNSEATMQKTKRTTKYALKIKPAYQTPQNTKPVTVSCKSADSVNQRINAKSELPRPMRASSSSRSIPRSGIPARSILNRRTREDSWSEGCY